MTGLGLPGILHEQFHNVFTSSRFYPDGLLRLGFSQGSVLGRYGIWLVLDFGGRGRFAVIDGPLFVEVHEHVSRGSDQWNADDDAPQSSEIAGFSRTALPCMRGVMR